MRRQKEFGIGPNSFFDFKENTFFGDLSCCATLCGIVQESIDVQVGTQQKGDPIGRLLIVEKI